MASGTITTSDQFTVAGAPCQVIEVIHTTDASGAVTFAEADVALTVQQSAGVALASVSDTRFCAFVLQGTDDTSKYGVGVYHPELGLRIAPSPLSVKPISQTIVMGWACPDITIQHDAVPQTDEYVTFLVERQTADDGLVAHIYGADRFTNMGSSTFGEWMTSGVTGGGWTVTGAGDADFNGDYEASGTLNGKSKFVNANGKYIFWNSTGSYWVIGVLVGEIGYYTGDTDDTELPANPWSTDPIWGTEPAPTVSENSPVGEGIVRQNRADGTGLQQIYFPCGQGALCQRQTDLRDDEADPPEHEYLATLWCYHRGQRVQVIEGQDVTLNYTTGSIAFTGTPNKKAFAWIEDLNEAVSVTLDGAGAGTITGLKPGHYTCVERPADGSWASIAARTSCDVTVGNTTNVTLPALASPPANKNWLYIYDHDDVALSGDLYEITCNTLDGGTCEAPRLIGSGSIIEWDWDDTFVRDAVLICNSTAFRVKELVGRTCYEAVCRARCLIIPTDPGELVWWSGSTPHRDLFWDYVTPPHLLREIATRQADVGFTAIPAGVRSGLVRIRPDPTYAPPDPPGQPYGEWHWDDDYTWQMVNSEGTVLEAAAGPTEVSGTANGLYHTEPGSYDLMIGDCRFITGIVGGKLSGNIVDGDFTRIHAGNLAEANRYGLEWGDWQRCEVRVLSSSRVGCITANTCPVCHGPVWRWPSTSGYIYGYCTQTGCGADARTWVRLPTVGGSSYDVRVLRCGPQTLSYRLLDKWLRPVDYLETGAQPWVCVHPTLATWSIGTFTDGDDNAAIATTNGLSSTVYVQPKIDPINISAEATYTITCAMAAGTARDFVVTLPAGLALPKQITTRAKVDPADAEGVATLADCDFIADVTGITSSLTIDPNSFLVVGDTPALVDAQTPIAELKQTPWACQFLSLYGQPDIDIGRIDGITHLVWTDEGSIYYAQVDDSLYGWRYGALEPEAGRVQKRLVMDGAKSGPWDNPSVTRLPDDRVIVTGHDRSRARTAAYITTNQGETWEALAMLGSGLTLVNAKAHRDGVLHIAGYSAGSIWYQRSDDGGTTLATFGGAGGTVREVSNADAQQPGVTAMPDGRVLVVLALNNEVRPMVSSNGGETWAVADVIN